MKCPACEKGMMLPAVPHENFSGIPCDICKCTNVLPENIEVDYQRGKEMKEGRLKRGVLMRIEAKNLGISASDLSRMERGYFEKRR